MTRSNLKPLLAQWTRSSYSKNYRITFSLMDQKWSYFCAHFYKNCACDSNYCSATFGRGVSDEVKLSCADDMGVWFSGLNACNFRRILLFLLFAESQGAYGLVKLCCDLAKASVYTVLHVSSYLKK